VCLGLSGAADPSCLPRRGDFGEWTRGVRGRERAQTGQCAACQYVVIVRWVLAIAWKAAATIANVTE